MANIKIPDADGLPKYIASTGAGSDVDPILLRRAVDGMGEVQANPTANTLLARIKSLEDKLADVKTAAESLAVATPDTAAGDLASMSADLGIAQADISLMKADLADVKTVVEALAVATPDTAAGDLASIAADIATVKADIALMKADLAKKLEKVQLHVAIDFSSASDHTIIAAPGEGNRIRLTRLSLISGSDPQVNVEIALKSGATTIETVKGDAMVFDYPEHRNLGTNEAFVVQCTTADRVIGGVDYYVEAV